MSVRIDPTVGRIVWFYSVRDLGWGDHTDVRDKPRAAIVVDVLGNDHVNLGVFDRFGTSHPMPSVRLLQDGETRAVTETYWAEWMPFQKGQAAKQEQAQGEQTLNYEHPDPPQRTIYDERAKVEAQRPSPPVEEADLSSNETRAPRPKPLTPEALKGLSD